MTEAVDGERPSCCKFSRYCRNSVVKVACVAGVRRGGKGKRPREAREAREDGTREDRGGGPSPSRAHFDFPPSLSLRPATQATKKVTTGFSPLAWLSKIVQPMRNHIVLQKYYILFSVSLYITIFSD